MIHRLREAGKLPSGEVDFTLFTFGHDPVTLERLRDSAAVCLLNRLSDVGLELTPRTADAVSAGAADAARKIVRRAAGTALYELWRLELELGLRDGDSIRTIVESGFRQLFAGDASERELRKLYAMTGLRHVLSLTAEQVAVGIEACHPDLLNEAISKAELSTFRQARSAALRLVGPIKHEPRLTAIVQLVDDHRILQIAVLVALANQRKTD